jgi:hypothetical protein
VSVPSRSPPSPRFHAISECAGSRDPNRFLLTRPTRTVDEHHRQRGLGNGRRDPYRPSREYLHPPSVALVKTHALPFILLLQKPQHAPRQRTPPPPPHQRNSASPDAPTARRPRAAARAYGTVPDASVWHPMETLPSTDHARVARRGRAGRPVSA